MLYSKNCLNSYLFYYNPHKNFISVQNLSKCSSLFFIRKFKSKSQTISSNSLGKNFNYFNLNQNDETDKRFSFFNFKNKKNNIKEIEKIKTLLNNSNLKEEDKLQIKIAFAEGYLAGGDKNKTKVKTKLYKVIENLFWLAILFCAYIYFFGNGFKIVWLGNKHEISPEDIEITFNDALGIDEAKSELKEVVEFLKDPDKFTRLGGKLPKGVLLVGPPGTGKTLLARAVAGEAGVPFFHAAGSEFDEILVGQGARRIRDLFAAAKTKAPCVIFIDEIDSVGSKRSNSYLHPYANQTINQLLSEMDGFHQNEGVIVLGATNRRNDLDTALLRPGRFDVEVRVGIPDLAGRVEILTYYLNKIKLAEDIDINVLAKRTLGFSGADIENMCNQAALKAAIEDEPGVLMKHLDNARDKVLMGPEKKKKIPDEEVNRFTAYHEAGHTLVAYFSKNADPVHKVTIIPRGQSLGSTAYIPDKEPYQASRASMLAKLDVALGGRVAEEMIFGEDKVTSGAYSDLRTATRIAQNMVKHFGMSNKVGLAVHENKNNEISNGTLEEIESEVKRLLQESYERAKKLLKTHNKELHILAQALLKHETLDLKQIKSLLDEKNINSENNN